MGFNLAFKGLNTGERPYARSYKDITSNNKIAAYNNPSTSSLPGSQRASAFHPGVMSWLNLLLIIRVLISWSVKLIRQGKVQNQWNVTQETFFRQRTEKGT